MFVAPFGTPRIRNQGLVFRLNRAVGRNKLAERAVDPLKQLSCGTEVRLERRDSGIRVVGKALLCREVGGDVGPAEAVDGLLRIPDSKQPAGRYAEMLPAVGSADVAGGYPRGQFSLNWVRVLEFVQHDAAVA